MLASLLPGLRDLRTPLAAGYLWLVVLWLLLHDYLPESTEEATGPVRALYELGGLLGSTAVLAAVSFIAYLLGSMLVFIPDAFITDRITPSAEIRTPPPRARIFLFRPVLWAFHAVTDAAIRRTAAERVDRQVVTFVSKRLREDASHLELRDHLEVLQDDALAAIFRAKGLSGSVDSGDRDLLSKYYALQVYEDLPTVGIQLQAKNRDLWDTYDRLQAESEFRVGIVPPLFALVLQMTFESGTLWWVFLFAAPLYLSVLALRHWVDATSTLVQAVVLRIVEPPVLERLREYIAKKAERDAAMARQEEAWKQDMERQMQRVRDEEEEEEARLKTAREDRAKGGEGNLARRVKRAGVKAAAPPKPTGPRLSTEVV